MTECIERPHRRKWKPVAAALAVVLAGAFAVAAIAWDQACVTSSPYAPSGEPNRDVAVVYYSRTGSSEAVARGLARHFNAPLARIDADYPRGFSGHRKAVADAKAHALPAIEIEPIDIGPARRVFLVSPIWALGPATPILAYAEKADLAGKEVVLVTIGDNRFEQEEIDAFAKRLEARKGRLARHVFLRRGSFFWKKGPDELVAEARAAVGGMR